MSLVADVVFDAPLDQSFTYRVPVGVSLEAGQRVLAPLGGAQRVGLVVAARDAAADSRLRALTRIVDEAPVLGTKGLDLARWIAAQSLTSLGSTALSLLPPAVAGVVSAVAPAERHVEAPPATGAERRVRTPSPTLVVAGSGRERRVLELIAAGPALVIVSDVESAGRWAVRLAKLGPVVRLDSGVSDAERAAAWAALGAGDATAAVGTRSALLAPLAAGATAVLVNEHDPAHKPPGPPRLHSRDVILARRASDEVRVVLTSATPSVETWSRCARGDATLAPVAPAPWPSVTIADPRGIARREALTPPLARAMREALGAGRRVFLGVARVSSMLGCDECGVVVRCDRCGVALAWSAAQRRLTCWICADVRPPLETCPQCGGRRLGPFGWGIERVEQSVRRRFPSARVARYEPETRGRRAEAQRAAAAAADVVIGTRGALRLFGPGTLGAAGFISPDQLLGLPDFRAAERAFALLWAAAERVRPGGDLVVQSRNASHYALQAISRQDLAAFYAPELRFREELGYPPFRRLAFITLRPRGGSADAALTEAVAAALRGSADVLAYPAITMPGRRGSRIVIKGGPDLPMALAAALGDLLSIRRRSPGIMDVEIDPVEWQS